MNEGSIPGNEDIKRYRAFHDTLPVPFIQLNNENKIVFANKHAAELLHTGVFKLVNKKFLGFIPEAEISTYAVCWHNLIQTGTRQSCEISLMSIPGHASYCRLDMSAAAGSPIENAIYNVVLTDITYQKKIENTQLFLLSNSWVVEKIDFFKSLSRYLAMIIGADYVSIDKLHGNIEAESLAAYFDGVFEHETRYSLNDSPCSKIGGSHVICFAHSVRTLFTRDQLLQKMNAEGYIGIKLYNSKRKPIGIISCISRKPLIDVRSAEMILTQVSIRAAAELEHRIVQRRFEALNRSNNIMLHATTETEMMNGVCNIITKDCGYALMWIGMAVEDEYKSIVPVASSGFEAGYLETLKLTYADVERGRGPTGTAIRTGKPSVCDNLLTNPSFKPWRAEAIKRGYASSIALPLNDGNKTFGAMMIYSKEAGFFDMDEVKFLTELANDLAVGITTKRLSTEVSAAMNALAGYKR